MPDKKTKKTDVQANNKVKTRFNEKGERVKRFTFPEFGLAFDAKTPAEAKEMLEAELAKKAKPSSKPKSND